MPLDRLLGSRLYRLLLLWLVATVLIGLVAYGIFAFARYEVVRHQWGLLEAIADDREAGIAGWVNDRRDETLRFSDNPAFTAALGRVLAGKSPGAAWPFLQRDIEVLLRRPHYQAIALVTADGRLVRVFGTATEAFAGMETLSFPPDARVSFQEVVVGDAPNRQLRIIMIAPLRRNGRVIGAMVFAIQPYLEVGAALATWPWPESSVEVLLFRRRADHILFLTRPKDAPEPVLFVKADPSHLATQATAHDGRLAGLDYRGQKSLGVARRIDGTPWHMLVKIERAELNGLIQDLGLFAGGLSLLLVGVAGLLVYSRFYQLRAEHHFALLEAEVATQRLARRFDYLAKYANDIIILADAQGRVLEVNDRASATFGYTRDELLGRPLTALWASEETASVASALDALRQRQSTLVAAANVKKNGERFFTESSFTLIEADSDRYVQIVMRDITERRKAETRIHQLNRLYATLSRANEAILHHHRERELLTEVCDILLSQIGFFASWAMTVSADGRSLELLVYRGPGEKAARELLTPETLEIARGATASTLAIRDGHSVQIDDLFHDPRLSLFHRWASDHAGSAAAFPIYVEGRAYGVIGIYASAINAFDSEVMSLLQRMASDLGFAIRNLRQARALADSEERLSLVFRATRDCYWDIRFDLGTVYFNPTFRKRIGIDAESMKIEDAAAFLARRLHPDDLPHARDEALAFLHGGRHRTLADYRLTMANGRERWIQVKGRVVRRTETGAPLRMAGALADVTEHRRTRQHLQYWEKVFNESRESIVILDRHRRVLAVNKAFTDTVGYSADEALGKDILFLSAEASDRTQFRQAWEIGLATGYWQGELRGRRRNGEAFSFWVVGSRIKPSPGGEETFVTISTDLTESKTARERIRFLSNYDSLTGLPNRQLFRELLDQAIVHAQRKDRQLAVLFLDIDRFKNVNDSLGHAVGDLLLQELAERLTKAVSPDDTVSRQGGDDFIVLLTANTDSNGLIRTAMGLLNVASRPFLIEDNEISLTASIGIAIYPIDGVDSGTLIKNADTAMYYSKERGNNNFQFFFHELNVRARRRLSLATELRRTVERGEFSLHYQPQIDIASGRLVGVEALIRWPRQGKLMGPSGFIPLAEEMGLIVPIGEWVIQAACRQRGAWRGELGEVLLAVNLSALQFREKQAIERLGTFIHDNCAPQSVEFELTESVVMHEAEESVRIFHALKERGVRLALDDFGTGYSSLNYLRRFPMDRVKVDQSFIHGLASESSNKTITDAIIGLSQRLGMIVLAEGVETAEEMAVLKASGCDQAQGFYVAPPLSADALVAWWQQRTSRSNDGAVT